MKPLLPIALYLHYVICSDKQVTTDWKSSVRGARLIADHHESHRNHKLAKRSILPTDDNHTHNSVVLPTTTNNNNNNNNNSWSSLSPSVNRLQQRNNTNNNNSNDDEFPNSGNNTVPMIDLPKTMNKSDPCIFALLNSTIHRYLHEEKSYFSQRMNVTMRHYFHIRDDINKSMFTLVYSFIELDRLLSDHDHIHPIIDKTCKRSTYLIIIVLLLALIIGYVVFKAFKKYYAPSYREQPHETLMEDGFYNT